MSILGKLYLFFEKIVVYQGLLDRPSCIDKCDGHLPGLANIDALFHQINLTTYEFSFHVNADYDFVEHKWMWAKSGNHEVDNYLWFQSDYEYYPKNHDIIQIIYEVCEGDGSVQVMWRPVSMNRHAYLDRINFKSSSEMALGLCNDIDSAIVSSSKLPPYYPLRGFEHDPANYTLYSAAVEGCKESVGLYTPPEIVANISRYFTCDEGPHFTYRVWTGYTRVNLTHFTDGSVHWLIDDLLTKTLKKGKHDQTTEV